MDQTGKVRKLGKGLAGLMGVPVAVPLPPQVEPAAGEDKKLHKSNITAQVPTYVAPVKPAVSGVGVAGGVVAPAAKGAVAAPKVEGVPQVVAPAVSGGVAPPAGSAARGPNWPSAMPAAASVGAPAPAAGPAVRAPNEPRPQPLPATEGGTPSPYVVVRVDEVIANRFQPRQEFDEPALAALAASIKRDGMMQPLVVRRSASGKWELIAGERRWRAAKVAGLVRVPAVVVEIDDVTAALWAVVENVQRVDLGALEKSAAYGRLSKEFGLTQQQISEQVGEDRTLVSHYIRLAELEPEVRELIRAGKLTFGHGKVLNSPLVKPGVVRVKLAERTARETLSVRQLEQLVQRGAGESLEDVAKVVWTPQLLHGLPDPAFNEIEGHLIKHAETEKREAAEDAAAARAKQFEARANVRDLEEQIGKYLGTKVKIKTSGAGKRGVISLEYYSLDHFDGLVGRMGVKRES